MHCLSGITTVIVQTILNNVSALVLDVRAGTVITYVGNIYQPENKET
jgi:hypothetical protein